MFLKKPRKMDHAILSPEKMRIYNVQGRFSSIYKEYLELLAGKVDIDPSNYEVDFLSKTLSAVQNLALGGHAVD